MVVFFDRKIAPIFMIPPHIYLKIPAAIWNNQILPVFIVSILFYFLLFFNITDITLLSLNASIPIKRRFEAITMNHIYKTRMSMFQNLGKIHISPSNYHSIVNVPLNYQLCQCTPSNYQKMSMSPLRPTKRQK